MASRLDRGFSAAIDCTRLVTHSRYRMGAAIFNGKKLLSLGWNQPKTHPESDSFFNWQHAELNSLIGMSRRDLSNATMFVARMNKSGKLRISKPCESCQRIIRAAGIRTVWFINRDGEREKMAL